MARATRLLSIQSNACHRVFMFSWAFATPLRSHSIPPIRVRSFATAKSTSTTSSGGGGGKKEVISDHRITLMKEMLYAPSADTSPLTPTVADEKTDTMERAWFLHQTQQSADYWSGLRAQYMRMREANLYLAKHHPALFEAANRNPISKDGVPTSTPTFPRRLSAPTDTPPLKGWKSRSQFADALAN